MLLCLVVPISPCLRLGDKVAVYHREPRYHPRSGRLLPGATGQWQPIAPHRVHAQLVGLHLVVVVQ